MKNLFLLDENDFARLIYSPISIFKIYPQLENFVKLQLETLFRVLQMDPEKSFEIIRDTSKKFVDIYLKEGSLNRGRLKAAAIEAEKKLHQEFNFFDFKNGKNEEQRLIQLKIRAEKIYNQIRVPIKKYLNGKKIKLLDLGCGDGLVAKSLRDHKEELNVKFKKIYIADIVRDFYPDYRVEEIKRDEENFPFTKLDPDYERLEIKNGDKKVRGFDCILLLTVLHHSINPRHVFRACCNILKKKGIIIVIESCVGITRDFAEKTPNTAGEYIYKTKEHKLAVDRFLSLSEEEIVMYATFIDWFYNRVLHKNVLLTYNFTDPSEWNETFESFDKMVCLDTYCEGFDQLTVPEFHTLHVIGKK